MNRREFLKLFTGGIVGLALVPSIPVLPIKETYFLPPDWAVKWGEEVIRGIDSGLNRVDSITLTVYDHNRKGWQTWDAQNCDPVADLKAISDSMELEWRPQRVVMGKSTADRCNIYPSENFLIL